MKHKSYFSILTSLVFTVCLALTASTTLAQKSGGRIERRNDPQTNIQQVPLRPNPQIVYLKCEPSKSDVSALVTITNNTSQTLPQGTMIFAKNQKGLHTNYTIGGGGLKPNAYVTFTLGGSWTDSGPCSAYAKK